jgi:transposase InsO family protein
MMVSSNSATINVWHKRFAHVNEEIFKRMANGEGVTGMEVTKDSKKQLDYCHGCNLGKMHKLPFETSKSITNQVGELIHSDVVGPMQVASPNANEARYYILLKDDFSRYKTVYFMKQKSEAIDCIKLFTKKIQCETGKKVKILRSDNGGEFTGNELKSWLSEQGIIQQTSAAHTPEQNGKAERDHRTTVEAARSLIHARNLSLNLWAEAVNHSVYTLNRTFSKRRSCTPYELWHRKKPNVANLRIFGSTAYVFVPEGERQKLDA